MDSNRSIINTYTLIFFFNAPATTEIYTLSLHDALPIREERPYFNSPTSCRVEHGKVRLIARRSEEHTSELQSRVELVCRLLLDKKNRRRAGAPGGRDTAAAGLHLALPLHPRRRSAPLRPLLPRDARLPFPFFFLLLPPPPRSTLFPYTTLFRSRCVLRCSARGPARGRPLPARCGRPQPPRAPPPTEAPMPRPGAPRACG